MKNNLRYIFSGMKGVLKYEGIISLISRGYVFLLHRFFMFDEYYAIFMKTHRVPEDIEIDFLPKTDDFCLKIITSNKEADKLVSDGFVLGAYELNLRASLDKGVVSFCLFVGREFAHVSCLADNSRGKKTIDPRPLKVDYQNGEVVVGRALTVPKFRRLGLQTYNGYVLRKYCRDININRVISSVNAHNIPALASNPKAAERYVTSKYRFIKALWFTHIKETKMEPTTTNQIVAQMTGIKKNH